MAVTLETELQSLMFSSQIPDIVIGTSDEKASSNQHDYSLFNITPQSD